jgi:hypothetical protein
MRTGLDLLVLMIAVGGAWLAAVFAALGYFRAKPGPQLLTAQGAAQLLRAETDIVRGSVEDRASRLRQELNQSLKGFQELTVSAFGGLRDGIHGQVRGFGERLDGGIKLIDERAASIAAKLNGDMAQMRSEANTSGRRCGALSKRSSIIAPTNKVRQPRPFAMSLAATFNASVRVCPNR